MRRRERSAGLMGIRRVAVLMILAMVATGSGIASAAHTGSHPKRSTTRPLVLALHLTFHRMTIAGYVPAVSLVMSNGRYLYIGTPAGPSGGQLGLLYDDQTGTHVAITGPASCLPVSIGGPWLLFNCGSGQSPALALYSLSRGQWQTVVLNASLQAFNAQCAAGQPGDPNCGAAPIAVGADWIEFGEACGYRCPSGTTVFQNIQTGQIKSDPTGGRTIADLSSPVLARRLCSPLRARGSSTVTGTGYSGFTALALYGRFALVPSRPFKDGSSTVLERCGSKIRMRLRVPVANSREVIWASGPHRLSGLLLPSLRRFEISVPANVSSGVIVLGSRRLYLLPLLPLTPGAGQLWTAVLPG
jgi:hypothetical protein